MSDLETALKVGEEAIEVAKDQRDHIKLIEDELQKAEAKLKAIDIIVNDELLFATRQEEWFIQEIRKILRGNSKWLNSCVQKDGSK